MQNSSFWRLGDLTGRRKFCQLGHLDLELGNHLPDVVVAYETWGELNTAKDNAVLLCHALTGDTHAVGEVEPGHLSPGWWDEFVGPGKAIDTDKYFVVAPNVLGGCQGTTGPSSLNLNHKPYGSTFPKITIKDQVEVEFQLAEHLGIKTWRLIAGGSMGGMRALEWAVAKPGNVKAVLLMATSAYATADQIATQDIQVKAIEMDPDYFGGDYYLRETQPIKGLGLARRIAHQSYRTEREFKTRFGRQVQPGEVLESGGRFAITSYLDHQADKLTKRFDANSYKVLTNAMSLFDVGLNRGGVLNALSACNVPAVVVAISSDRLYPKYLQQELVDNLPNAKPLVEIDSDYGHDAFLLEVSGISSAIDLALEI